MLQYHHAYVDTPKALYCLGKHSPATNVLATLCNVLNVFLLLGFIRWLRLHVASTVKTVCPHPLA